MISISPAAFLYALHAPARARPGLCVEARAIWPVRGGGAPSRFIPAPWEVAAYDDLLAWASDMNRRGFNAFFGVNPRTEDIGTTEAVAGVVALPLDFDVQADGATALRRMFEVGLLPTFVVASGRGIHAYLALKSLTDREVAEAVGRRLCHWLGSDAVFDPPRVMRLPSTVNWKPAAKGAVCTVTHFRPDIRYSLDEVERHLDAAGAPHLPPEGARHHQHRCGVEKVDPLCWEDLDVGHGARLRSLIRRLPQTVQGLLVTGLLGSHTYKSRSEADMAVVRALINTGADDDEIAEVFRLHPDGIGERTCQVGVGYLHRTIQTARETTYPVNESTVHVAALLPYYSLNSHMRLLLTVLDGPHLGRRFVQGLARSPKAEQVWRHAFAAFDLPPPAERLHRSLKILVGREAKVVLGERLDGLEVKLWLPSR